jgi:hypothetical protein
MKKLVCTLLSILFLTACNSSDVKTILSHKVNEFNGYGNDYTISYAKEDGFFVEDTIPMGAPNEMIRFIEHVWHGKGVDLSISKVKDESLILSYLIYRNDIIYVLDYNSQDKTYGISEYKYLTYDYDNEKGIQSRYLTNDKNLKGKDKLTEEQKSNSYYLCSYQISEN